MEFKQFKYLFLILVLSYSRLNCLENDINNYERRTENIRWTVTNFGMIFPFAIIGLAFIRQSIENNKKFSSIIPILDKIITSKITKSIAVISAILSVGLLIKLFTIAEIKKMIHDRLNQIRNIQNPIPNPDNRFPGEARRLGGDIPDPDPA